MAVGGIKRVKMELKSVAAKVNAGRRQAGFGIDARPRDPATGAPEPPAGPPTSAASTAEPTASRSVQLEANAPMAELRVEGRKPLVLAEP